MTLDIHQDAVPIAVDATGVARVGGTRVPVETILARHHLGESPEYIAESYPAVALADVYAVLAYYCRHRAEVDAYLQQVEREEQAMRKIIDARDDTEGFRRRLLARRAAAAGA